MKIVPFRESYNDKIDELETTIWDAYSKIGNYISTCRMAKERPDWRVLLAYDELLLASNAIKTVRGFGPSIRFSDEERKENN